MPKQLLKSNVFLEMENGKGPFFGSTKSRFASIAPHVMLWSFPLIPPKHFAGATCAISSETLMNTMSTRSPLFCLLLGTLLWAGACQRGPDTANTNVNMAVNANSSVANTNANTSTEPISTLAAREPDTYKAVVVLSAVTEGGDKTIGIPTLSAEVARNGADRRVAFKLPDGSDLIYLEKGDQHIVLVPSRKQYAELTPEATGFQLQKLMTPGQMVSRLEKLNGIERVGEETVNGRTAVKYRYSRTSSTNTQAGTVNTEAFFYIDKETGLPLRSELSTEASGNVQGVKGATVIAEMRDISTTVDSSAFEVPAGYSKVPPEQIRQQINALTNMASALVRSLLANAQASPTPTVSPAVTSSPSP